MPEVMRQLDEHVAQKRSDDNAVDDGEYKEKKRVLPTLETEVQTVSNQRREVERGRRR